MLILSILLLLISNAVALRRDKSILYSRIAITVLICCFLLCMNSFHINLHDKGLALFGGLYLTTIVSLVFHMFIFLLVSIILLLNSFYPRKIWTEDYSSIYKLIFFKFRYFNSFVLNKMSEQYRIIEYSLIILFIVLGGIFLISSCDLISIFLSIELQSYGLYILCVLYRNSERATSGGLTYFLLGGLSSCFILLGSGLLYANSGNTSFDALYVINNISNASNISEDIHGNVQDRISILSGLYQSFYINLSFIIMSIGFLFKVSAAPFHFWSPDVYDAIPTVVTTFVAVFAKISIFILLLELVHYTSNVFASEVEWLKEYNSLNFSWTFTLLISSLLSLIIGAVLGLTQFRIKRLYAYSTISHIGFILLALTINNIESIQSFIFYLMQYSISNLNAFIILVVIGYSLYLFVEEEKKDDHSITTELSIQDTSSETTNTSQVNTAELQSSDQKSTISEQLSDINNSPMQLISQMKGFFYINPMLAISLAITLFSFIGIPPLIGFFAKQMVLSSALENGYVFMALIAILSSVISAYYYLVLVKQIFFNKTDYKLNPVLLNTTLKINSTNIYSNVNNSFELNIKNIQLSSSLSITISVLTLIILLFMLNPQEWLNMITILTLVLFNH